jgi:hypothetical protein
MGWVFLVHVNKFCALLTQPFHCCFLFWHCWYLWSPNWANQHSLITTMLNKSFRHIHNKKCVLCLWDYVPCKLAVCKSIGIWLLFLLILQYIYIYIVAKTSTKDNTPIEGLIGNKDVNHIQ